MQIDDTVWLISGCSSGFGREIALCALGAGARVVVTARRVESVADIGESFPDTALCLPLDVTDAGQRRDAVARSIAHFGQLDVLVNNAGYGYVAAVEEGEEVAVRTMFEANFFGALYLTLEVLPHFRERGSGRILNNSSQAGLMANPGTGYYSASKHALEGLMEALGKEVAPLGIRVTTVQPGAFRTDWSGRSMQRSSRRLPAYAEHVGSRLDMIAAIDGKQPGDPRRAAQLFVQLATMEDPPPTLVLGRGLLASYREKLAGIGARLDAWEETSLSVDYPAGE
ncbi:SDR family NAD(P)-dependent oxidoreductase [Parahaliea maris]|uniref:SDR family NAD(P)-dependent oxidoreductase n=1 Tax=Parahaliea maris TaxID=2716870 RepID=A0A5C9A774_9GAMM|nr:oxidoreductase [Parahaliea maris]TXS96526.1 SDR family NAD(P)-dependent oxidoreductase [Parahaliea maris]